MTDKSVTVRYFFCIILFIISSTPSFLFAYEFTIESCPATNDLFEHTKQQIDHRIDGVVANDTSKKLFSVRGNFTSSWVRNSSVWTNNGNPIDTTGMSPWNSRGGYTRAGTLITPRHIVFANHYPLSVGDTVLFVANDNTVVTRTITNTQRVVDDVMIGKLSSDVPATITHYPILSNEDYEKYINDGGDDLNVFNLPIAILDQEDKVLVKNIKASSLFTGLDESISHQQPSELTRLLFNETLVPGDSGNPGFVLIGDMPVLVLTHYSAGGGPSYSYYRQSIQDVINSWGGEHQLSTIDLSCFNAPIVLDNSSPIRVIEGTLNGAIVENIEVAHNVEGEIPYFSITSGNGDGVFAIDQETGSLTLVNESLINDVNFPRTIGISVEENGPGGRMSTFLYSISIASYPYFNTNMYEFDINENSSNSAVIGDVNASDAQDDTLVYAITSGNDSGIFTINPTTGLISVANSNLLNYEVATTHILTVEARESDTVEQLSSTVEVRINVKDTNYAFTSGSYLFQIDELDEDGTVIGSVSASIVDPLNVSSTYYQIVEGNDDAIFTINPTTGVMTVADNTNLDGNDIYNLIIGVSDGEGASVLNSVAVTVRVSKNERPTLSYSNQGSGPLRISVGQGTNQSFTLTLSAPYSKNIVANLVQVSGNGTLGTHYALSSRTVTFLPGETSKTVVFNASETSSTATKSVILNIEDNTRVTVGSTGSAIFTINKNQSSGGGGGGSSSSQIKSLEQHKEDIVNLDNNLPTDINSVPINTEEIKGALLKLQAQLAQLLLQTSVISADSFTRDMDLNTEGEDVRQLQQILISKGYSIPAGVTGFFGAQTQQALIRFQKDKNIVPSVGYFGPITRSAILN